MMYIFPRKRHRIGSIWIEGRINMLQKYDPGQSRKGAEKQCSCLTEWRVNL